MSPAAVEAVLGDFRAWLGELSGHAGKDSSDEQPPAEPVDLFTLVSQFTALRHEVNMQTRAARAAVEANAETLRLLAAAPAVPAADAVDDDVLRPLLKSTLDVVDALTVASNQVGRLRDAIDGVLDDLERIPAPPLETLERLVRDADRPAPRGRWRRWLGGAVPAAATRNVGEAAALTGWVHAMRALAPHGPAHFAGTLRRQIAGLADGYAMSLRRVERVLPALGLERIASRDAAFDADAMEAVDVAAADGVAAGTVVDEVRAGYRWRGRVFRFAQVRVAR